MNNDENKSPAKLKGLILTIFISLGIGICIGYVIDQRGAKVAKFKN